MKQFNKGETVDSIFQTIIDNNITNIRLFISGSHVGMMKDLLEEKNALYSRFSLNIKLKELAKLMDRLAIKLNYYNNYCDCKDLIEKAVQEIFI